MSYKKLPSERHAITVGLFQALHEADDEGSAEEIRAQLVELHLPLAQYLARRFSNRGEAADDLLQVASIGLIKAVDRFDPARGVMFSTYATPTILGELKRHFRDRAWPTRTPRGVQECQALIAQATAALEQEFGRSPTVAELADHLARSEEEVLEGLEATSTYTPVSLDSAVAQEQGRPLSETLGEEDAELAAVVARETVRPLLAHLSDRGKRLIVLRYFHNMTQAQIAEELGVSQMHVSRLLAATLKELREALGDEEESS